MNRSARFALTRNSCLSNMFSVRNSSEQLGAIFTLKMGNRSAVPNRSALFRNSFSNNRSGLPPAYKAGKERLAEQFKERKINEF